MLNSCLTESSLNVAVTVTGWLVGSVVLAAATGFSGATLSMFVMVMEVTSDTFVAASMPRNCTVPLSSRTTPVSAS